MSDIEIWASVLSSVGFPIGMSIYLLFRFEKIIIKNTEALQALKTEIMNGKKKRK